MGALFCSHKNKFWGYGFCTHTSKNSRSDVGDTVLNLSISRPSECNFKRSCTLYKFNSVPYFADLGVEVYNGVPECIK